MSLPRIVVVGGHGKVAIHFAKLASNKYNVASLVRTPNHFAEIEQAGATPKLLSLEDASEAQLSEAFEGAAGVLFSAGAGGKGGKERTKAVDEIGAIKVFDAIEAIKGDKPTLVLVGALDTRDMGKPPPSHYTEKDIEDSKKVHEAIGAYYDAKLAACRDLHKRSSFRWVELRPGHLTDDEGTGRVKVGKTGMGSVSRKDVAATIVALFDQLDLDRSSSDASNKTQLALDLIQGDEDVDQAVKNALDKGESDFTD
ncbi:hypothetical protein JCM10212_004050 [Sporobolomyces blumeae]